MAGDHRVQQRGVEHRARARAALVQGRRAGDQPVARHRAVGRFDADGRGQRRRLADRPAGVGADGQRRLERRQRRGAAAARAAGHPVGVPRVAGRAVGGVLGRAAHRELVHVGLAEDRDAGGAQPRGHGRVVRRHPALEDLRPAGGRHVGGGEHVLERQRHPGQRRRQLLAGGDGGVDRGRRRPAPRRRRRAGTRGSAVGGGDLVQAGLGHLDRGQLLGRDLGAQRRGVEPDESLARRSSRLIRSPPGSAAPRTGRRPPPAPRPAPRPGSGTAARRRGG